MRTLEPAVAPPQRGRPLARASWVIFLGIFIANALLRRFSPVLMDLVGLVAALAGLGVGVAALVYVRREGWRGILIPALIGAVLNALVLLIWVTNFAAISARHR